MHGYSSYDYDNSASDEENSEDGRDSAAAESRLQDIDEKRQEYEEEIDDQVRVKRAVKQQLNDLEKRFQELLTLIKKSLKKLLTEATDIKPQVSIPLINEPRGILFESLVKKYYQDNGYSVTTTTKTNDDGIDLVVKKNGETILVQCKQGNSYIKKQAEKFRELVGTLAIQNKKEGHLWFSNTEETTRRVSGIVNRIHERYKVVLFHKADVKNLIYSFQDVELLEFFKQTLAKVTRRKLTHEIQPLEPSVFDVSDPDCDDEYYY